jgi:hypothetical protein
MVVFGSDSDFRLSHVTGDEARVANNVSTTIMTASVNRSRRRQHTVPG